jgi:hypothetical protein
VADHGLRCAAEPALEPARDAHQRLAEILRQEFEVVPGSDASADAAVIVGTDYPIPRRRIGSGRTP